MLFTCPFLMMIKACISGPAHSSNQALEIKVAGCEANAQHAVRMRKPPCLKALRKGFGFVTSSRE